MKVEWAGVMSEDGTDFSNDRDDECQRWWVDGVYEAGVDESRERALRVGARVVEGSEEDGDDGGDLWIFDH